MMLCWAIRKMPSSFLVHPSDSQARFSFSVDEGAQAAPPPAPIVPLKNCIRVLNGFGKSLEVILPKLRDGYIVPDAAFARNLALENPQAFFLSQSGECFHNVTVTGGKQRAVACYRSWTEVAVDLRLDQLIRRVNLPILVDVIEYVVRRSGRGTKRLRQDQLIRGVHLRIVVH